MAEYIEREAALKAIKRYGLSNGSSLGHHSGAVELAAQEIATIPAADVAPVVHGRWKTKRGNYITGGENPLWCCSNSWCCSNCGYEVGASLLPPKYNHCPSCGAKMDGEKYEK